MFRFVDRMGNDEFLEVTTGDTVERVLARNDIPHHSVLVTRAGVAVAVDEPVVADTDYEARLIEGYDLGAIRQLYRAMRERTGPGVYVKRAMSFARDGSLVPEVARLDDAGVTELVESAVLDTIQAYSLIEEGTRLLVGLSGGVDSSSLLLALANLRPYLPEFELVAVTFEDFDSRESPTFVHAAELAGRLGVEHHIAAASLAEETFNLNQPLREILPKLMETGEAHQVMYVDHHTTRRALEVFAQQCSADRIALGLHTTDLIAGLLNGWLTGYSVGDIPKRRIGSLRYVYPLAFVSKLELHHYHRSMTGVYARHSQPNAWEVHPKDRNFYYFLADQLQALWPGIETMLFTGHHQRQAQQPALSYEKCANCSSDVLHHPFTAVTTDLCDACVLFRRHGYLKEPRS